MEKVRAALGVFDYSGNKLCDLYDSQNDLEGQAYDITFTQNMQDGIHELTFKLPYISKDTGGLNFRWPYIKSEYLIRLYYNGEIQWYIAKKPVKSKTGKEVYGTVTCHGSEVSLKTKNIYMEFDDSNGIGTADELLDKILAGTGWSRGVTDPILESDGVTEKIRSMTSGDKQGALGLIVKLCNLFKCYPVFDSDKKKVLLKSFNNRVQILEGVVGQNLDALSVSYNSDDIITRLYCEGEYGDNGYVGIDSANPTGLNYILNFDYYREIGVMTSAQETALTQYVADISAKKAEISANIASMTEVENDVNTLIGQCKMALYYGASGYTTPYYVYGDPTNEQKRLSVGDRVVVLKNNGRFRYAEILTTPQALIQTGEYGIAKFITGAAGSIGAKEVAIEAKEKQVAELQRKIDSTTKADKIAEYNTEIATILEEIYTINVGDDDVEGLYDLMDALMKTTGLISSLKTLKNQYAVLSAEQDDIEATFIIAMGDLLRDGYWPCKDYIPGQEEAFYNDAVERLRIMSRPSVSYQFNYIRVAEEFNIPIEDIELNALFRINDDELQVYDNLFITKIVIGVDNQKNGTIVVSNDDITISSNDLGTLLSRMSQLADLIEQRNSMYDRAKAIAKNGTFFTDRLNGQINVMTNQILSTVSNWYTDEQGNIMFLSADGGSAMMLSGAGWMIASSKDDNGNWIWRTAATGEGLTADVITAGFISAERIESNSISANKLEPNVGSSLVISGNPTITDINGNILDLGNDMSLLSSQVAPEFDTSTSYSVGDLVMRNKHLYIFTQDHPAGPWNPSHVADTSVSTQIELMPDKITQYVGSKGYGRTFIQLTDPADDPTNDVHPGDYWIRRGEEEVEKTWGSLVQKNVTWQTVKNSTWFDLYNIIPEMYCRKGTDENAEWILVNDTSQVSEAYTRIEQTMNAITLEAYRANAAEGEIKASIEIQADVIRSQVERLDGIDESMSIIEQTADMISSKVERIDESMSIIEQTADDIILGVYPVGSVETVGSYIKISEDNMTISSGGEIEIRSTSSTESNPDNAVKLNNSGIEIMTNGTFKCSADNFILSTSGGTTITLSDRFESVVEDAKEEIEEDISTSYIAKTSVYQDADSIRLAATKDSAKTVAPAFATNKAYAIGDIVSYNGKVYRFKAAHSAGAWNASHVDETNLDSYVYHTQSSIDITSDGIEIAGGKYVQIKSGDNVNVMLDEHGIDMRTAGKFFLHALDDSGSSIIFGEDEENATFSVGTSGDIVANSLTVRNMTINGGWMPKFVVSDSEPDDDDVLWIRPVSQTEKMWSFMPSSLAIDTSGGTLTCYKDYTLAYTSAEYLSGDLFYGIKVRYQFYPMSGYANHTLKARLKNGDNWIDIGSVTTTVGSWGTLALDVMMDSAAANVMSSSGGNFTIRIECSASGGAGQLLKEDVVFRARTGNTTSFSACDVYYKAKE